MPLLAVSKKIIRYIKRKIANFFEKKTAFTFIGVKHDPVIPFNKKTGTYTLGLKDNQAAILLEYSGTIKVNNKLNFSVDFFINKGTLIQLMLGGGDFNVSDTSYYHEYLPKGKHHLIIAHAFKKSHKQLHIKLVVKGSGVEIGNIQSRQING